MRRKFLLGFGMFMMIAAVAARAASAPPEPPCGGAPSPAYPATSTPRIEAWSRADIPAGWTPPACTGWQGSGALMLVALAGSFRHQGSGDALLARFAAVSAMRGIRYWSVTDKSWRPLIVDASALAGPDPASRRQDFSPAELKSGQSFYFLEDDSRSGGVVYRMRLIESTPDRFVLAVENATPIKFMLFTLFAPGEMQSVYFVERRDGDLWGYYSLLRAGPKASSLVGGHAASYMNRAQALYRYFLAEPTDQGQPAAR